VTHQTETAKLIEFSSKASEILEWNNECRMTHFVAVTRAANGASSVWDTFDSQSLIDIQFKVIRTIRETLKG